MGIGEWITGLVGSKQAASRPPSDYPSTQHWDGRNPVQCVERNFARTCLDISMILQEVFHRKPTLAGHWSFDRGWVASAAFAYFIYEWWSHRKNEDDPKFLRALNGRLYALADDVASRMNCDREHVVDAVRQAYPEIRDAFRKLSTSQPHSMSIFTMDVHLILVRIVLEDHSVVDQTMDSFAQLSLGTLMTETFAAFDSVKKP